MYKTKIEDPYIQALIEDLKFLCNKYVEEKNRLVFASMSESSEIKEGIESIEQQIAVIGKKFGKNAGLGFMRAIGNSLPDPKWISIVNSCWDGIEGWQS